MAWDIYKLFLLIRGKESLFPAKLFSILLIPLLPTRQTIAEMTREPRRWTCEEDEALRLHASAQSKCATYAKTDDSRSDNVHV